LPSSSSSSNKKIKGFQSLSSFSSSSSRLQPNKEQDQEQRNNNGRNRQVKSNNGNVSSSSVSSLFPPFYPLSIDDRDGRGISSSSFESSSFGSISSSTTTFDFSSEIEGVLPVRELFYRSTQSIVSSSSSSTTMSSTNMSTELAASGDDPSLADYIVVDNDNNIISSSSATATAAGEEDSEVIDENDDEELPFSAEQSGRLSTPGNKIRIRRNNAASSSSSSTMRIDDDDDGNDVTTSMGENDGILQTTSPYMSEAVRRELTAMVEQERDERQQSDASRQGRRRSSSRGGRRITVPDGLTLALDDRRSTSFSIDDNNSSNEELPPVSYTMLSEDGFSSKPSQTRTSTTSSGNKKSRSMRNSPNNNNNINAGRGGGGGRGGRGINRKMVRRGMEMLVGGEPINADPPQRFLELNYYRKHPRLFERAITTNSPDFGPLMNMHSVSKVGRTSVSLYCENFVAMTSKWGICPSNLSSIVTTGGDGGTVGSYAGIGTGRMDDVYQRDRTDKDGNSDNVEDNDIAGRAAVMYKIRSLKYSRELNAPKGFGGGLKRRSDNSSRGGRSGINSDNSLERVNSNSVWDSGASGTSYPDDRLTFTLGGELKFSLGVSRSEIESNDGKAFRRVLLGGIDLSINAEELGFDVQIAKLALADVEGGSTDVTVQFQLYPRQAMGVGEAKNAAKMVNGALASAMDDGKMAMMLARAAREEKGWPDNIRDRIVEEFLFEIEDEDNDEKEYVDDLDDEGDDPDWDDLNSDEKDRQFGMDGELVIAKDDMWLGGGNGGVFFDYSESNLSNAPYKGKLGPYLLDAAIERARQNQPKVIAIGDVHGCIDELKALLRKCDYHPGDTIIFLGDLVCKGPDSLSVVQMAREIGAIGVRGNHDFEVVRWHQAIKSGADPPVIGSEHYLLASALSTADLKWMYSLPWFISSSHLNALFVHAGFVSGIRLAKQNPRLMMNMRSILPDGTVTSKFFNNWPWARLWDGPQTVFFGHDADRGLQQYEHAVGLDTGCVYGGKLTACILPERRLVSVNAKREYFQYRRKHFD
jgi:hypothetical protein